MMEWYIQGKENFVGRCVRCGVCAARCPVLEHTDLKGVAGEEIQAKFHTFLATGEPDPMVYTRAFSCMECFKCVFDICPLDLNPMMMNQWVKGEYLRRGLAKDLYADNGDEKSLQRIIASLQVIGEEYECLTTPSPKADQGVVFFPGCNAYFQPEKLLSALDIMDALEGDYAFLPGLDHCCGDNALFFGRLETGTARPGIWWRPWANTVPRSWSSGAPPAIAALKRVSRPGTTCPLRWFPFPSIWLGTWMN